jgi:diguanylate cyclase (GGDEF)-like protein
VKRPRFGDHNVAMTAALGAVLIALAAFVIQGTVQTSKAAEEQHEALAADLLFADVRNAVSMQEVYLRHYEVQPEEEAHQEQFDAATRVAVGALATIAAGDDPWARQDALRLRHQQVTYQTAAKRMMTMVLENERAVNRPGGPPAYVKVDREEVTPAFYALLSDVDGVFLTYHVKAQREAAALQGMQNRQLAGTSLGFAVGLVLIALILRMVIGHQRRLAAHAAQSRHQALHDPLTGLPNRALFAQRLADALTTAGTGGHQAALMVIDLDGFKQVNDTLGHHAGDTVLIEAGRRLATGTDGIGTVARLGGDEFAVLLPRVAGLDEAITVGERLVAELRRDFAPAEGPADISGSLGIALGPRHGDAADLFRHADAAMYRAKSGGGGVAWHESRPGLAA